VNIYNSATLNPNLKTKIRYHLTFSGNSILVFWHFNNFYYILLESTIVYRSDGLKSLYQVDMKIRNSKIAVRMQYENNFMQLHNK